ncbi:MAG: radical SAM protein [Candidatus Omnitrophota bacterium]
MVDLVKKRYRFRIILPAFPAFNIYSGIARKTTALGPITIASVVNEIEGWDVEVIDENNLHRNAPKNPEKGADHELLQKLRPADIIGFYGGLTSTIPRLYELAGFYKAKGIITIAGGQHFAKDNIAEALNSNIDYVVIGEGEYTIRELIPALKDKKDLRAVKGIAYKDKEKIIVNPEREKITDFDSLPLPDFSLLRYADLKVYPVERIRGCGMNCEFCTVRDKPRCATPERLLQQISALVETQNAKAFFVVDDLFGQQREETIRFCRMLTHYQKSINRRLDLITQIRLDKAKDTELLLAMRAAGVNMVAIGYESPIEEELNAMNKHINPREMINLTRVYSKMGFLVHGMFIFGYPMQENVSFKMSAKKRIRYFRRFIQKAKLDTIQVLLPVPLPGTELRERLIKQNRVYPMADVGWEYYDGNFPLFTPDEPLSAEDMLYSVKKIMGRFYEFKYMFMIGLNIFSFPSLVFFLHNIRAGWRRWYRPWRNSLIRFGGWIVLKKWKAGFKKDNFLQKVQSAQGHLNKKKEPVIKLNMLEADHRP